MSIRQRLLEAAASHFAQAGYHGTTVRGIARAARVSPGQVRHHFTSKEDLFEAALAEAHAVLDGFSRRGASEGTGLEAVIRYMEAVLTDERGRGAFHVSAWGLATPTRRAPWPQPGFVLPLQRLIETGQLDGSISRRGEPELLALSVLAVVIQAASPLLERVGGRPDVRGIADYLRGALTAGGRTESCTAAPASTLRRIQ